MPNPPITLYGSAYPVAKAALEVLTKLLIKGQESGALPSSRLYEDMSPFTTQVQYVCNIIRNLVSRTTEEDLSAAWNENEELSTFDDMHTRITVTKALVEAAEAGVVNEKANETFTLVTKTYGTLNLCRHAWVSNHILPYLFFYLVTAYAILRKDGVPLRLPDYMDSFNRLPKP